jgi:Zn-dependent peptidase ImmA (M78 family)
MKSRRDAIFEGTRVAAELHERLNTRSVLERSGGPVNVFGTIVNAKIPLVFKPLDGLLGAYLTKPAPGIIVTTKRPLSVQRFTGAHELGHAMMHHEPSLDDEAIITRAESPNAIYDSRETAANTFATDFLLPRWLIITQMTRHRWTMNSLTDARIVYQLALRAGTSFEATTIALLRHRLITDSVFARLRQTTLKDIKQSLLEGQSLENWYPDIWLLTEADEGTFIQGDARDVFVVRLQEHSAAGYLWDIEDLNRAGFVLLRDDRLFPETDEDIGGAVERVLAARAGENWVGHVQLVHTRPWEDAPVSRFSFTFDLRGKENGKPRAVRRPIAA